VVLDRLASPLAELLYGAATGDLSSTAKPRWHDGAAVTVVIAAEGYPESRCAGMSSGSGRQPQTPTSCTPGRR